MFFLDLPSFLINDTLFLQRHRSGERNLILIDATPFCAWCFSDVPVPSHRRVSDEVHCITTNYPLHAWETY